MIVVDTNVIAYLWIPGAQTALAEQLLTIEPEWSAPVLWRSEFRNVLAGCIRRRRMSVETASSLMDEAEDHMRGREFAVPSAEVLRRVHGSPCSAYDCEFVVLADELARPLVTTDRQVLAAFPTRARSLERFVAHRS